MPFVGLYVRGKAIPFSEVPSHILAPEMVNAIQSEPRNGLHVSDLTICPVVVVKQKQFDYYLPRDAVVRIIRGNMLDLLSQQFPREGAYYQKEVEWVVNGYNLKGTPDIIDPNVRSIEDFKGPQRLYEEVPETYEIQLNAYRWLVAKQLGQKMDVLYLNCVSPTAFARLEVPIYEMSYTEDLLKSRLDELLLKQQRGVDVDSTCENPDCYFCRQGTYFEEAV